MADETQVAPVAGAQENNATQEQPTKVAPFIYYYSDPDEAETLLHHLPIPSFIDLSQQIAAGKLWHIYNIPAPSKDMEDPIVDVRTNAWVENSKNAQTKVLAEATQAIDDLKAKGEELDQANAKVDQAMKTIQTAQQNNTEQNEMLTKGMAALMKSQKDNNKLMMSMQKVMENLAKQNKDVTTPEAPATDTSTQSTNKQENGGN